MTIEPLVDPAKAQPDCIVLAELLAAKSYYPPCEETGIWWKCKNMNKNTGRCTCSDACADPDKKRNNRVDCWLAYAAAEACRRKKSTEPVPKTFKRHQKGGQ